MKRIFLLLLTLGLLALAACSPDYEAVANTAVTAAPVAIARETALPTNTPMPEPTVQPATATPTPEITVTETAVPPTPTITPTATPAITLATASDDGKIYLEDQVLLDIQAEGLPCFPDIPAEIVYAPTNDHFLVIPACIEGDNYLYLFRADGTDKRLITEPWDYLNFNNVTWAEDGQSFVYQRINSCCLAPPPDAPPPGMVRYDLLTGEKVHLESNSYFIYNDADGIWLVGLDNSQSPPVAAEPRQLVASSNVTRLLISPDGKQIAYLISRGAENKLGVVTPSGENTILVDLATLPYEVEERYANVIYQFDWLPDSQTIAFNTLNRSLESGYLLDRADLWLVGIDGELTEQFAAGTAGTTFALSPDGTRLLFGNPESIVRVNLDSSNAEEVLTFPYVATYSEFEWAPLAQWSPDGRTAYTAIAPADILPEDAEATLYHIPESGTAVQIGTIPSLSLDPHPSWNHNMANLGYVLERLDNSHTEYLVLTDGDGRNPTTYGAANSIWAAGWNATGTHFLYSGATYVSDNHNFVGIAQPNQPGTEVPLDGQVGRVVWLTNDSFLLAVGSQGDWELGDGRFGWQSKQREGTRP